MTKTLKSDYKFVQTVADDEKLTHERGMSKCISCIHNHLTVFSVTNPHHHSLPRPPTDFITFSQKGPGHSWQEIQNHRVHNDSTSNVHLLRHIQQDGREHAQSPLPRAPFSIESTQTDCDVRAVQERNRNPLRVRCRCTRCRLPRVRALMNLF